MAQLRPFRPAGEKADQQNDQHGDRDRRVKLVFLHDKNQHRQRHARDRRRNQQQQPEHDHRLAFELRDVVEDRAHRVREVCPRLRQFAERGARGEVLVMMEKRERYTNQYYSDADQHSAAQEPRQRDIHPGRFLFFHF
ncbi:MAG TPA: hypothetical protein VI391_07875 [Thermoanaerobaculia bacterium]